MTIQAALQQAKTRIGAALDAQLLLCHVLGVDRTYLFTYPERELTSDEITQYESLVVRAAAREPFAYIVGRRGFYDLDLIVTPDVLIPRPETELLLERALAWAKDRPTLTAVDVGTGSGALAVAFARHAPQTAVHAADVSEAALNVARRNAEKYNLLHRITFHQGDLLSPLIAKHIKVDLVMANLPYIPTATIDTLDSNVRDHEPRVALDGGGDGLALVRRLIAQIPSACSPHALILLEIGADQGAAALEAAQTLYTSRIELVKDYAGLDRIVDIRH
jgi:release factor glutamine methyltransferase